MNCLMILSLVIVAVYCHEAQESLDKLFKVCNHQLMNFDFVFFCIYYLHIRMFI